jgi:2-polyprenyl-6-hydroxyphenyl methylase/3-demethylubiquinone-9 3-methyltransferase
VSIHQDEVRRKERFEFGANWALFIRNLSESQIREAEESLRRMLAVEELDGLTFLDVGCGSGLFSLAARRLGASVRSFDFDPLSVACASELRRRYFPHDSRWTIDEGSALDTRYLSSLGQFDIVYSWGVLHHTGAMWEALQNVVSLVAPNGRLFIAIYNDQGTASRRWTAIKRLYIRTPRMLRPLVSGPLFVRQIWRSLLKDFLRLRPFHTVMNYEGKSRGMTAWRDHIDWIGGYPFEVAKPEEIIDFYHARGFQLRKLKTCGGSLGCNEFVLQRITLVA